VTAPWPTGSPGPGRPAARPYAGPLGVRTPPGGQQRSYPAPSPVSAPTPAVASPASASATGGRATAATGGAATTTSADGAATDATKKSKAEFNVAKVIAGAGAASTTAVVGSSFGAAGTVAGAAIASVVTAVATTTFQRSLETTSRTVKSKVKLRKVDPAAAPTMVMRLPVQRGGADNPIPLATTTVAPAEPARRLRFTPRRIAVMAALALAVFGIGLFVVTGIEWIKGSPLSGGDSGTSVGRVLQPAPGPAETTTENPDDRDGSSDATESGAPATPTPTATPAPRSGGGAGSATTSPPSSTTSAPATGGVLPRLAPGAAGSDSDGSAADGSGSGG
jgi:hypothetical protein